MTVIIVTSPKGGTGRTTVAANLAAALAQTGRSVTAIDFDPQDSLKLHLGWRPGWTEDPAADDDAAFKVRVIPHAVAAGLLEQKQPAGEWLGALSNASDIVIVDTPACNPVLVAALAPVTDVQLCVLLADAASMAALPLVATCLPNAALPVSYILNQVDDRRRLSRDSTRLLARRVGPELLGIIRRDEAVAEALAMLQPVSAFAPASAGSIDFNRLAGTILQQLDKQLAVRGTAAA